MRILIFASLLGCAAADVLTVNGVNYVEVASGLSPISDYISLTMFECHQLALGKGQTSGGFWSYEFSHGGTRIWSAFDARTNGRMVTPSTYFETENTLTAIPYGCCRMAGSTNKIVWGVGGSTQNIGPSLMSLQKTTDYFVGLAKPNALESATREQLETKYSSFCTE